MVAKGPLRQVFTQSLRSVPDTDHKGRSNFLLLSKRHHGLIQPPIDTSEGFLRLKQILAIMHIKDIKPAGIAFAIIRRQPDIDLAGLDVQGRHAWKMMEGTDQIRVFDRAQIRLNGRPLLCAIRGPFAAGLDNVIGFQIHHVSSQLK
jgi:hypothetical protein